MVVHFMDCLHLTQYWTLFLYMYWYPYDIHWILSKNKLCKTADSVSVTELGPNVERPYQPRTIPVGTYVQSGQALHGWVLSLTDPDVPYTRNGLVHFRRSFYNFSCPMVMKGCLGGNKNGMKRILIKISFFHCEFLYPASTFSYFYSSLSRTYSISQHHHFSLL